MDHSIKKQRNRQIFFAGFAVCYLLSAAISAQAEDGRVYLNTHSLFGAVKVKSWKTLRDERIMKQDLDYSCGAASLATVLNEHYGQAVTEQGLLQAMDTGDFMSSFEDMHRALEQFGFRALGFATSYEQQRSFRTLPKRPPWPSLMPHHREAIWPMKPPKQFGVMVLTLRR